MKFLPKDVQDTVTRVMVESFDQRMRALIGFVAVQFLVLGMLWRRPQFRLPGRQDGMQRLGSEPGQDGVEMVEMGGVAQGTSNRRA